MDIFNHTAWTVEKLVPRTLLKSLGNKRRASWCSLCEMSQLVVSTQKWFCVWCGTQLDCRLACKFHCCTVYRKNMMASIISLSWIKTLSHSLLERKLIGQWKWTFFYFPDGKMCCSVCSELLWVFPTKCVLCLCPTYTLWIYYLKRHSILCCISILK